MNIIEKGPGYETRANLDLTEVEIVRDRAIQRGALRETTNIMSRGVWVAHGLEEREGGMLYERWVKHTEA